MSEINNNKVNDELLNEVVGGNDGMGGENYSVTSSTLNCRYWPNGEIAKVYERGHRLKVDGLTTDGQWWRLWIYDPRGGECYGYIYRAYTELD